LVGTNLLVGHAAQREVTVDGGGVVALAEPATGDVYVAIPPNAVGLHRHAPEGSPRNVWPGKISGMDLLGDRVRVHVDGPVRLVGEVTAAAVAELGLSERTGVWASVKATEITVYPR